MIAVALILLVMTMNLRGVRESGVAFAIPTYFFLLTMTLTVCVGLFRFFTGTLGIVQDPPHVELDLIQPLTWFLILRAFANGTTSLTGVEAISNGITAFKEPRSQNAGKTLMWMSGIVGSLLLCVTFLFLHAKAIPAEGETMISQLARTVYDGRGFLYLATISGTTIILAMAANTAFAGFPRLSAMIAEDGYLPRQMAFLGSRLVFSRGIVILALFACALVIFFQARVSALIPLYAIGVFLSFTLSQSGMALRCGSADT
jgi:amino acid transporter